MRRFCRMGVIAPLLSIAFTLFVPVFGAIAQDSDIVIWTRYPTQHVELGETVNIPLSITNNSEQAQIVHLGIQDLPAGWQASFSGDGRIVESVFVGKNSTASANLKLEPPDGQTPGEVSFGVSAGGASFIWVLPLVLIVKEQIPLQLKLEVEIPIRQSSPGSSLSFQTTLENEGDQEVLVNLSSVGPDNWEVDFSLSVGSDNTTTFPLKPGESKRITARIESPDFADAGDYDVIVRADASGVFAEETLTVQLQGKAELSLDTEDGRVSLGATAGQKSQLTLVVKNTGTADLEDVTLSSSPPSGWTVEFNPAEIERVAPDEEIKLTAFITPSDRAIAGDYIVRLTGRGSGDSDTVELRVAAATSALWGVIAIILIAIALGIVGLAVYRFGRR